MVVTRDLGSVIRKQICVAQPKEQTIEGECGNAVLFCETLLKSEGNNLFCMYKVTKIRRKVLNCGERDSGQILEEVF